MALVGLLQTLHLEGEKFGIRVKCLAPSAATRMTEDILSPEQLEMMSPQAVSHGLIALVADDAPSRMILCAGAGAFECAHITLTQGRFLGHAEHTAEALLASLATIRDRSGETVPSTGLQQSQQEYRSMMSALASA